MGKYAQALGVWVHQIEGIEHRLTPRHGDNERLGRLMGAYSKHQDQARLLREIREFYVSLVQRENTLSDEDLKELELFVELNQMTILNDILVEFKWTTREELAKAKEVSGDTLKNLKTTPE